MDPYMLSWFMADQQRPFLAARTHLHMGSCWEVGVQELVPHEPGLLQPHPHEGVMVNGAWVLWATRSHL